MSQPKVFVTRLIPEAGLKLIRAACTMDVWQEELPPPDPILLERVRGVNGILSLVTDRIDAAVMDAAGSSLKVISNYAVGFDNIDVPEATRRGIAVGNTPGVLTDATADLAFALLMAAARRVVEGDRVVRVGGWKTWGPTFLLGEDVHHATLGIVGFGRIGQALAKRARGFEMRVLYHDPQVQSTQDPDVQAVDLETLLRNADFISLHVPLTPETYHLISQHAFELMKPTAVLINTARGGVVDAQALYWALKEKRIFAAALDVTEPEPIPMDSPLLELDNLIITPHIASASTTAREKMAQMAAENLLAGVRGERLPYPVNEVA